MIALAQQAEMEFLNGIISQDFWAKTWIFSDSRVCLVLYPLFPVPVWIL